MVPWRSRYAGDTGDAVTCLYLMEYGSIPPERAIPHVTLPPTKIMEEAAAAAAAAVAATRWWQYSRCTLGRQRGGSTPCSFAPFKQLSYVLNVCSGQSALRTSVQFDPLVGLAAMAQVTATVMVKAGGGGGGVGIGSESGSA